MSTSDELKAQGTKAFTSGNYPEAIELYTKAIEIDGNNHVLYSNRSAAKASLQDYEGALEDANKTVELNPNWSKGYSRKGAALHGLLRFDDAITAYEAGLKIDPQNQPLIKGLEDARSAKDEPMNPFGGDLVAKLAANPKARHLLNDPEVVSKLNMLKTNPNLANSYLQDPKMMQAILAAMGIDATMPPTGTEPMETDNSTEKENISQSSKPTSTEKPIEKPVEEIPTEVSDDKKKRKASDNEKDLGNSFYKKREFEPALEHYNKAYELDDTNVAILTNKAAVLFEMEKFEDCIKVCEEAVEKGREVRADFKLIARAFGRIGNSYLKLDKLDEAIKYFNHSLAENRTAAVLEKLKETEKLKVIREKEAYFNPELSDEARAKGNELFKDSKFAEAVKEYTEAIKRNEKDPRAYCNRAQCYIKLMALYEADKDADSSIDVDPTFPKGYIRKAQVFIAKREFAKAMEQLEKAKTIDTEGKSLPEINQQLQKCYQGLGQVNSGTENREETLKRAMADPEVQQALADPVMQSILAQMQENPAAAMEHMKNPAVASKIRTLINAGVLQVR